VKAVVGNGKCDNPRLILPHRMWIRNQRKKYPALPTGEAMEIDGECACGNCGCLGNRECGHGCLDTDNNCTLLGDDTCPCCMIESMPATDAQVDAATGQRSLFANNEVSGAEHPSAPTG